VYHATGLTREEIPDLCAMIWQAAAETGKADWPPSLGLYKSVVVTLSHLRRNRAQAEIAESFPTFIKLVRTPASVVDLGEGFAEVVGERVGSGDDVGAGLDLDGAVTAGGLHELAD
jgi:hypothetical protein